MTNSDAAAPRHNRDAIARQAVRPIDSLARGLSHVGGLLLMGLMLLLVADVALRFFGGPPIPATIGISEVTMAVAIFVAFAHTQRTGSNVRVELVVMRLSPRARRTADLLNKALVAGASIFVTYYAIAPAIRSVRVNEHWPGAFVNVPLWPGRFALVLGGAILALVALRVLLVWDDEADRDKDVF